MGIYKIENVVNNKVYIGLSANLKKRINWHKTVLNKNKHYNQHLQQAWNKYGNDNFTFSILFEKENIPPNLLEELETLFIKIHNSFDLELGYNLTVGGDNCRNYSQETRDKLSKNCSTNKLWNKAKTYIESIKKPVAVYDKVNNITYYFDSTYAACNKMQVHPRKAYRVLTGSRKSTHNLEFKYITKEELQHQLKEAQCPVGKW